MIMNSNRLRLASFKVFSLIVLVAGCLVTPPASKAGQPSFTPSLGGELRFFPQSPAYEGQLDSLQPSFILSGDGRWTSDDRKRRVRVKPFLRLDGEDSERTHFDLRELSYSQRLPEFDVLAGNAQVFWGVAESHNVVDVINQFDTVENGDEGDKLGQSLLRLGKFTDIGRIEFFYLPYFRERTFPGEDGRQRSSLVVDTDNARYERSAEETAGDVALRYKHQIDMFDVGAHLFAGTGRDPFFTPSADGESLIPTYQRLSQGGLDVQWTSDAWLLKFEATAASQSAESIFSTVAGFEYTFFDLGETGIDVGLLAEGLYDTRDDSEVPLTLFDNDVFAGTRVTWNDIDESELLVGGLYDVETGAVSGSIDYETRIGSVMVLEAETRLLSAPEEDPLYQQRRDSNFTLRLTRYF